MMRPLFPLVPLMMLTACAAGLDDQPWAIEDATPEPVPEHIVPRILLQAPTGATSCEHTGKTWTQPAPEAPKCLDEVFGQDGCLSARVSYAHDAQGALSWPSAGRKSL